MSLGRGVEWAVHCVLALATVPPGERVAVERLAALFDLSATYLAKHMQALTAAGIVEGGLGRRGGYILAKPATRITVRDIVDAVDGPKPLFWCTEIRRRGPFPPPKRALRGRCGVAVTFDRAEQAWRDELATTTIADLAIPGATPDSPAARWLTRQPRQTPSR